MDCVSYYYFPKGSSRISGSSLNELIEKSGLPIDKMLEYGVIYKCVECGGDCFMLQKRGESNEIFPYIWKYVYKTSFFNLSHNLDDM